MRRTISRMDTTMQLEITSLQHWRQVYEDLELEAPVPLILTQTYKEWLLENPQGYVID